MLRTTHPTLSARRVVVPGGAMALAVAVAVLCALQIGCGLGCDGSPSIAPAAAPGWRNYSLPVDRRVALLLKVLTLQEKLGLVRSSAANSGAVPRLGIAPFTWGNEALHGIVNHAGAATVFPQPIAWGATFNPSLIREIGIAVSDEARATNNAGGAYGRHT